MAPAETREELPVLGAERHTGEEIGPAGERHLERLLPAPARDGGMVTAEENVRDSHAAKVLRARVLRMLEQTVGEGIVLRRARVPERAGEQPNDGVDHHERGELAAAEHVVADREL